MLTHAEFTQVQVRQSAYYCSILKAAQRFYLQGGARAWKALQNGVLSASVTAKPDLESERPLV